MKNFNYDLIVDLPTDDNTLPSHSEIKIVDSLFQRNMEKIFYDIKDSIVIGILFAILSLPMSSELLKKFFPSMNSTYMSILIRTMIFIIIYYIMKNIHLVKKK